MNWDDLRYLFALHRHRSFARAARELGVDATTVGRRLAMLEAGIGARLVRRVAGGHALTREGESLIPSIEQIELHAIALERRARGAAEQPVGTVRVTAGDGLMNFVLVPALPKLRALHPGLVVELVGDIDVVDIARREADVALRLVRPTGAGLVALRLGSVAYGIYAGESYLRTRRRPTAVKGIAAHDWIGYARASARAPALRWLSTHVPSSRIVVRGTTTTTVVESCAAGLGLSLILTRIADRDPRLVRLLPQTAISSDAWVVYHQDDRASSRIRAVATWLKELL